MSVCGCVVSSGRLDCELKVARGRLSSPNSRPLIGFAELFTGGEESEATLSPQPPVNNSVPKSFVAEDLQISPYVSLGEPPAQDHEYRAPNVRRLTADFRPWAAALARPRMLRSLRKPFHCLTNFYKAFASESPAVCLISVT